MYHSKCEQPAVIILKCTDTHTDPISGQLASNLQPSRHTHTYTMTVKKKPISKEAVFSFISKLCKSSKNSVLKTRPPKPNFLNHIEKIDR